MEIIIWDNASQDGTIRMVRDRFSEMEKDGWVQLKLIEGSKNDGTYIPYNLALKHFSPQSHYILGLDADVELSDKGLINLINAAQEDQVAAVGARSVYYDKPSLLSHGAGFVNHWTGFYSEKNPETGIECDYVIGCCWLLNRNIFESLGGFDRDYYISHWEVDYCLRAKNKGCRVLYEPKAVALHKIPLKGRSNPKRIYYLYRNKIMLIKKTFRSPEKWLALTFNLLFGTPKAIYGSFMRNKGYDYQELKAILRAFYDGWLNRTGKSF